MDYKTLHISWLCKALDEYRKKHNTVNSDITIGDFIKENCKDDFDKIVVVE